MVGMWTLVRPWRGRLQSDLLGMVEHLYAKSVALELVDNPALSTGTPHGSFMLTILAAVAGLEQAPRLASGRSRAWLSQSPSASTSRDRS